jgi:cellulose biosynthesis protein BcsQ
VWHDRAYGAHGCGLEPKSSNQNAGVGKTTVTLGLTSAAAAAGWRVLVVDADPLASATWALAHEPDGTPTLADVLAAWAAPPARRPVARS